MDIASKADSANSKLRVIVVGCGLAGLATAIGIRRAGHEVMILEKTAELQQLGAGINVSPNGAIVLKEWGILEAIRNKANVPYAAFMRCYKNSNELSRQQLGPWLEAIYLAPHLTIHRADLHNALLEEARRLEVSIILNCRITRLNFSEPSIELSNGKRCDADVILGADGDKSICREAMLGPCLPSQDSGSHVFRISVKISEVVKYDDLVSLVEPPCINLWVGPGAFAMAYSVKKDGLFNIVLTCIHDLTETLKQGPQRADIDEVKHAFNEWDGKFRLLLDLAQGCSRWNLFETPEPAYWTHPDGRFTLLGDAAHPMLPWLGQGAATAFEDAGALGTLFSKIQHPSQLPDVLSIYERLRKPRTMILRNRSRAMQEVYQFLDGPLQQERDRQLQNHAPFDGFPNFLADPSLRSLLFGYNAIKEAEKAWETYLKGEWPSTRGKWNIESQTN